MGTKKQRWRPMAESHGLRGSFSQEPDEITLPGWLNAAKGSRSYQRVTRILELIRDCEKVMTEILAARAHIHTGREKWPREHMRLWRISEQVHTELQRALERYTFNVRLVSILIEKRWILNACCGRTKDEFCWQAPYSYRPQPGTTILQVPTYSVSEGDAVLAISRLAERGLLNRVRLCAMCGEKWLFAKHRNYRFCSEHCREKHFTSGDEYRQRKAQQMRVYRDKLRLKAEAEKTAFSHR